MFYPLSMMKDNHANIYFDDVNVLNQYVQPSMLTVRLMSALLTVNARFTIAPPRLSASRNDRRLWELQEAHYRQQAFYYPH